MVSGLCRKQIILESCIRIQLFHVAFIQPPTLCTDTGEDKRDLDQMVMGNSPNALAVSQNTEVLLLMKRKDNCKKL